MVKAHWDTEELSENYQDLLYVRGRYIHKDQLSSAIAEVVKASLGFVDFISGAKELGSPYKLVEVIDNRCNYRLKRSQFVARIAN